jgi:hypothetical protein
MGRFMQMIMSAKTSFSLRWCIGEEVPCWELSIDTEDKQGAASFSFSAEGRLLNVFVY